MTGFRISTPVKDFTGEVGGCAFAKGVYEGEVGDGPLAYFRAQGYTVEEVIDAPAEPGIDLDGDGVADLPAKSASKADWVAAAIAHDISQADAEKATKEQLFELLTTPKEADQ